MKSSPPPNSPGPPGAALAELARLRQGCYRSLGALFLYPDQGRLPKLMAAAQELGEGSEPLAAFPFFGPWQRLLTTLEVRAGDGMAETQEEYIRLFLVNPEAPPYESFYIDPQRRATGWIAAELMEEYAAKGLALSPSFQEPPDHVAVQLEFLAFLCDVEARAWREEALEESCQALKWQRGFLGQHLGRWFPAFARRVALADGEGLYALATEAAEAFIQHDRDIIALLLERLQVVGGVS